VPASRFMRAILHFYGVELHNLSPQLHHASSHLRGGLRRVFGD
jgi:hypothetical protein